VLIRSHLHIKSLYPQSTIFFIIKQELPGD
jgi:hypothetical protein